MPSVEVLLSSTELKPLGCLFIAHEQNSKITIKKGPLHKARIITQRYRNYPNVEGLVNKSIIQNNKIQNLNH